MDVSGQPIGYIFRDQEIQDGCSEMAAMNYHYTLRNIQGELRSDGWLTLSPSSEN